jgi:hypothetical protein
MQSWASTPNSSRQEDNFEFPFLGYEDTIIPGFWEIGLRSVVTHPEVESRLFMSLDGVNKASTAKWSVNLVEQFHRIRWDSMLPWISSCGHCHCGFEKKKLLKM